LLGGPDRHNIGPLFHASGHSGGGGRANDRAGPFRLIGALRPKVPDAAREASEPMPGGCFSAVESVDSFRRLDLRSPGQVEETACAFRPTPARLVSVSRRRDPAITFLG
jgi:hypothetical protein